MFIYLKNGKLEAVFLRDTANTDSGDVVGQNAITAFKQMAVLQFLCSPIPIRPYQLGEEYGALQVTLPANIVEFSKWADDTLKHHLPMSEIDPQSMRYASEPTYGGISGVAKVMGLISKIMDPVYSTGACLLFKPRENNFSSYRLGLVTSGPVTLDLDTILTAAWKRRNEALEQINARMLSPEFEGTTVEVEVTEYKPGDKVWFHRTNGEVHVSLPAWICGEYKTGFDFVKHFQIQVDLTAVGFNIVLPYVLAKDSELEPRK